MKKLVSILLVVLMVVSISGCKKEIPVKDDDNSSVNTNENNQQDDSSSDEAKELVPEEGAKLTYWAGDMEFAKEAAKAFEEKYGVSVTVEQVGFDGVDKLLLDAPAGNGPDVCWGFDNKFLQGYDAGVFLEMDSTIATNIKDELVESAISSVTQGDKLYGVPYAMETMALAYNKDVVEEPATTFEQIVEEAKEWNNKDDNKFYYITLLDGYKMFPFLTASGFELFGADGKDGDNPGFDSPEFLAGLKEIAKLKEIMPIPADDLKISGGDFLKQNFIDGKSIYYPTGPWDIKSFEENNVNYGIVSLPTINGKPMTPFVTVVNNYVSYYSKYPIAAQMFAEFMASKEGAELLYAQNKKITARKDATEIAGLRDDESLKGFASQMKNSIVTPGVARISYYWTITESTLAAVFDGTMTPEEAAEKAQADFEALVASE